MTKAVRAVIESDYLPENPFNAIYRVMLPNTLLMNAFHYYKQEKGVVKRINANVKNETQARQQKQSIANEPWTEESNFIELKYVLNTVRFTLTKW